MTDCCLCSKLVSAKSAELWNTPLFESSNFVALPSLGSMVEGWLLVVPKAHYLSTGALSPNLAHEMARFQTQLVDKLRPLYGNICAFEHGPARSGRNIGCGVDHAHLHLVPLSFDLATAADPFMPLNTEWMPATWESCRTASENNRDYLYLEQPIGKARIAITDGNFGSQIFRKAIAARLGMHEQFSWRDFPQTEVIAHTVRTLRNAMAI
jgi:ATP adenylyltransferase